MCAANVRRYKTYSQKFSRLLNFLLAAIIEFSQASDGTRKRRIDEYFGSLGLNFGASEGTLRERRSPGSLCSVRGRLPPAGGANRPAPVASCASTLVQYAAGVGVGRLS